MPKPYQDAIKGRTLEADIPEATKYEVKATPVDTYVRPPSTNSALQLAQALSGVNSNIAPILEDKLREKEAQRKDEGKAGFLAGETPDGQGDAYMEGFMELKMETWGRESSEKIKQVVEANKHDPNFDVQGAIQAQIQEDLTGLKENPKAISQYLQQIMPLTEQLPGAFRKYHADIRDQETNTMLTARVNDIVAKTPDRNTLREMMDRDVPTWLAMGKTRKEISEAYTEGIIANSYANQDPTLLDMAFVPGEHGVRLVDNPGVLEKVVAAQAKAKKLRDDSIKDASFQEQAMTWGDIKPLLATNPFDPRLDRENLIKHIGPLGLFNNVDDYGNFVKSVEDARAAHAEDRVLYTMWSSPTANLREYNKHPKFSKWYQDGNYALMEAMDRQDPNSVRQTISLLARRYERSGVAPDPLKGILSTIDTASVNALTQQPPADMMFAYQMYVGLLDSDNGAMLDGLTTPDSMAMLNQIHKRMGNKPFGPETFGEAVMGVKASNKPLTKEEAKDLVEGPAFNKGLKKAFDGEFTGWFTDEGENMSRVFTTARLAAKDLAYQNTDMSQEQIIEQSVIIAKRTWAHDGNNNFFKLPPNFQGDRESLIKGVSQVIKEAGKGGGGESFTVHVSEDGNSYTLFDITNSRPVGVPLSISEIQSRAYPATYGDPVAAEKYRGTLLKLQSATKSKQKFTKGGSQHFDTKALEAMDAEFDANYDIVVKALNSEDLTSVEKGRIRDYLKRRQNKDNGDTKKAIADSFSMQLQNSSKFDGTDNLSNSMDANIKPGSPANITELAAYYADKDPEAALVLMGEGASMSPYKDNNGQWTVGFGYNYGGRDPRAVREVMRSAGIPTPLIGELLQGKGKLDFKQAAALFKETRKDYENMARAAYGPGYDKMNPYARAVLFDIAYMTGKPKEFKETLKLFREGRYAKAAEQLSITHVVDGKRVVNHRRIQLWKEMLSGRPGLIWGKFVKKGK